MIKLCAKHVGNMIQSYERREVAASTLLSQDNNKTMEKSILFKAFDFSNSSTSCFVVENSTEFISL